MIAWFAKLPMIEKVGWSVLGLIILGVLFVALYLGIRTLNKITNDKDRVGLKIEFVKTVASIFGGLFFLATLYFTWANLEATKEKNQADLKMAQEKQITELYVKAIEQLGRPTLEERLGGIYALERIARNSEKDYGPIMEVLTAYVQANSPWPPKGLVDAQKTRPWAIERPLKMPITPLEIKIPLKIDASGLRWFVPSKGEFGKLEEIHRLDADIQAILTVIGRRLRTIDKGETQWLILSRTDLRQGILIYAHLEEAYLNDAHIEGADLREANLERAYLWAAHIEEACLWGAHLEGARLWDAHLERAILENARLEGADFTKAHLEGADLNCAHLEASNLRDAKGLTQKQIDSAYCDDKTKLPPGLKCPMKKEP
jgi:hypothetical protein